MYFQLQLALHAGATHWPYTLFGPCTWTLKKQLETSGGKNCKFKQVEQGSKMCFEKNCGNKKLWINSGSYKDPFCVC